MTSQQTPARTPAAPAAQRPASRLLLIVLCGGAALACVAAGLVALDRAMRARRDRQTVEWAEQAMKQGRYEEATVQFARAVARHPEDAELSVQCGDAFYALSASRPEALQQARVAWQSAARLTPNDAAVVRRLLRFQIDLAQVRPSPSSFRELGEVAQSALSIEPANDEAATARLIAMLGPWFSRADAGTGSESAAHEKLIASLGDRVSAASADDLAVLYYALASARRAVELRSDGSRPAAQQVLDRAERLILSAADRDARLQYRAAEGLAVLAEANRRLEEPQTSAPAAPATLSLITTQPATTQPAATQPAAVARVLWPTWDVLDQRVRWTAGESGQSEPAAAGQPTTRPVPDAAARCRDEARTVAARAATSAQPPDGPFVDVQLLQARLAEAAGDRSAAEQICRQTLAARPASLRAELVLVELVSESNPGEAIGILEQPERGQDGVPGPFALDRRELHLRASKQKARLYLAAAASSDDVAARQANVQKASAACDALAANLVSDAASLKLTGRLRMLQGRYADALRLLDRAAAMMMGKGPADVDLLSYRASTLLALHDARPALECLRQVLQIEPARQAERLLLAQTLIDEGRITESAGQGNILEKQLPQDPRVLALRVRWLIARGSIDPDPTLTKNLESVCASLPEASLNQKLAKAELAVSAGRAADAMRLLQPALAGDPGSVPLAVGLARAMIAANHPDQARHVLTEATRLHAGDAALLAAQKSLDPPPGPKAWESAVTGADAKAFVDAVHACRAAIDAHDLPRAKEEIDSMARLRPDEPLLFDVKYRFDLARQQWPDAAVCTDRLAQANFDGVEGLSYAFDLDVAREQPLAAACVARQLTVRFPQFVPGWLDLGRAMAGVGRHELAIQPLRHAVELDPNSPRAIQSLAEALQQTGQAQEADEWIAKGRRVAPSDPGLREMEFARQLSQGDPHKLTASWEAAVRREPQRPDTVIALARVYLRINALETFSNPPAAHQAVAKAVELLNGAVKKWPDDKDCSFWAAHATALAGDVAGGRQILRRLCDQVAWSARPDVEQLLADFCLTWDDPRSAATALRDAAARGARGPQFAQRTAAVLMQSGSWQAALDALIDYRTDPMIQRQRILIVAAIGYAAEAEKALKTALSGDPTNGRLMTLLGILYSATHDDAQAKPWLDRAMAAGDEELAGGARGALSLREKGFDARQTLADLAVSQEASPFDARGSLRLADAYARVRDPVGAARVLDTVLALRPSDKEVRLRLIAVKESAATPDWERVAATIDAGRSLSPSDWIWDATEARMWASRHDAARAAALMRHAVLLAKAAPEVADVMMETQDVRQARSLIPEELWMLLEAGAYDTLMAECDDVISHYGSRDMLSALAHHAKASVQRRTGVGGDGGAAEYLSALGAAHAAGGFQGASTIVEAISADAGADEAVRRINAYVSAVDAARGKNDPLHDARWDLLKIDLLRRNSEFPAAAAEVDKLMQRLTTLPAAEQVDVLRVAVATYLQTPSTAGSDKPRVACAALLERQPDDVWALNNMSAIFLDYSSPPQPQKAIEYGRRAYLAAQHAGQLVPQIVDTYGWALAAGGQSEEAIKLLKPVVAQLAIPEAEYHLAEAYLAGNDPQSAWPHLGSATQLMQRDQTQGRPVDPKLRAGVADAWLRATCERTTSAVTSWLSQ